MHNTACDLSCGGGACSGDGRTFSFPFLLVLDLPQLQVTGSGGGGGEIAFSAGYNGNGALMATSVLVVLKAGRWLRLERA